MVAASSSGCLLVRDPYTAMFSAGFGGLEGQGIGRSNRLKMLELLCEDRACESFSKGG